ncbi:palmitoyltransferase [Anaeramoeba ignava]|uniref:Palmitoyltransferase n=1 Tax=Anaeramoeba ignava TaxID=1746090 RepID=A0A9Q0R4K3_ANAIG|nr:palmitoyltransferase [Anaeramoeba ignava]
MEVKTTICPICFQKFSQERKPMIICEEHHSICESCFNTLNKCPFCANSLTNFKPIQNLDLLKSIDQEDTNSNLSQIPIIPLDQLEIEKEPFSSGISTDNFRATWKKKQVIIKKTRIQIDSNSQKQFENELNLIGKLKHPNILPIYGITKFENRFCIVMKYAEQGNLLDKIPNLQFQEKIDLSLQIIEGLRFLHSNSIIHGDLKLKNILISKNKPKISDFGMSQLREKTTENLGITFYSNYLAPEFLKQEKFSDTSCDIFSLSIILFEIFSSKRYFHKKNRRKAFIKMMNEKRPYFPNNFPKDLSKFIKKGWKKNPQERSTLIQFIQCLEKMKNSNQPEKRKELEQTNQQPNEKEKEKEKKKKSKSNVIHQINNIFRIEKIFFWINLLSINTNNSLKNSYSIKIKKNQQ